MKKPISKKKKNAMGAVITVVVIVAVSAAAIYFYNQRGTTGNGAGQWVTSGPFAINNSTYRLGDNIFMTVTGLKPTDVGKMIVYDPKGGIFTQVPFNGTQKSDFNYFFKPNTERIEKLCTPQDLVGNWTMEFQGTPYRSLSFQVINEWVPGSQAEIKAIDPC